MKKTVKLIGINLFIIVGLVALTELFLSAYFNLKDQSHKEGRSQSIRLALPNYEGEKWASQYWNEYAEHRLEYHSYVGWKGIPRNGKQLNIDNQGLRKTSNQVAEKEAIEEVAFLGGSTMWGTGANDEGTIPSFYASLNDSSYIKNLGQLAYLAQQGFLALQCEIAKGYRPDLVISYEGVNNTPSGRTPFGHSREHQIRSIMVGADGARKEEFLWATKRFLQTLSSLLGFDEKPDFTSRSNNEPIEAFAIELLESWLALKTMCDANETELLLILQPNASVGKPDLSNLEKLGMEHFRDAMLTKSPEFYAQVKTLMKENERYSPLIVHFADFSEVLDGVPNVYIDYCHLSPRGNEVIAKKIDDTITQRRLSRNGQP